MAATTVRRVGIVTHVSAMSGAELALSRLARHLDPNRYSPVVITLADGPLVERIRAAGIPVVVVPLGREAREVSRHGVSLPAARHVLPDYARAARTLAEVVSDHGLDILHTHSLKADVMGIAAACRANVPLVWHVHDRISADYLPAPAARAIQAMSRRAPARLVANSRATLSTLRPLRCRATVAYPGIETEEILNRIPPRPAGNPVIGMLGRIGPTKGQDRFVRAAAEVVRTHPQARFKVVGAPLFGEQDYHAQVLRLVDELGMAEYIEFTGFIDQPHALLGELTACVHASPVPEPFGQVIVEAMAAGVPMVVSDAGGASEVVRDHEEVLARLAAPGSVAQIASGLRWILDRPLEADAMRSRALESVRSRFTIETTAQRVMALWDTIER